MKHLLPQNWSNQSLAGRSVAQLAIQSWWFHPTAWRELASSLRTLRWLALTVILIFLIAVAAEAVAGLLELRETISPETAAWFRVSKDWSLFEIIGYAELLAAAVFLFLTAQILQSKLHYYLSALTTFLVLDDSLQLHERAGEKIGSQFFQATAALRAQDLGELSYFIVVILVALALLVWSIRVSTNHQRAQCFFLLLPLAFIAMSSTGLDLLHALVPKDNRLLGGAVAIVEDGSELLGFGILLLVAVAQWKLTRRTVK